MENTLNSKYIFNGTNPTTLSGTSGKLGNPTTLSGTSGKLGNPTTLSGTSPNPTTFRKFISGYNYFIIVKLIRLIFRK